MMRSILIGILVLMAAGAAYITFEWYSRQHTEEAYGAPFELVDQHGDKITDAAFKGHPTAVFFGYTHCPEVCPTTLYELDGWLKKMGDEGKDIHAYFVSIDPERDTPEMMDNYLSNVSDRIIGISGEPAKVQAMAKAFGIYFRKVPIGDGDYTMDHTASILLLDRNGAFADTIAYGTDADKAIAKLKKLEAGA